MKKSYWIVGAIVVAALAIALTTGPVFAHGGSNAGFDTSNTEWVENTHLVTLELDDWLLPWRGTSRPFFSCLSKYPFDYLLGEESIFCFRDFNAGPDFKIGLQ